MDVTFSNPSREELLARCRNAATRARARGTPKPRPSAKQRKQAVTQVQNVVQTPEAATADRLAALAEYEKDLFDTCGGDAAKFCRMKGVEESAIPIIQKAIEDVKAGKPLPDTLQELMIKTRR